MKLSTNSLKSLDRTPFFIRLRNWEYWPLDLVYFPVYLYWVWLGIRARAPLFFAAANPGIEMGGLFNDSKYALLKKVPEAYIPKTVFVTPGTPLPQVLARLQRTGIDFPLIAKPDKGERGFLVEKLDSAEHLSAYLIQHPVDLILQEYIDYPEEVSVLYYRFPGRRQGEISSLTLKKFLTVKGNGKYSLRELILAYPRAVLQLEKLEKRFGEYMESIPESGEEVVLEPIGNHSRGTTFLNGNYLIDERLCKVFDRINSQIEGVYFGRYDIRCRSLEDLKKGRHFRILEINGVKAEPTHIYQPGYPLSRAYQDLFRQWGLIYRLSQANRRRGIAVPSLLDGLPLIFAYKRYKRKDFRL